MTDPDRRSTQPEEGEARLTLLYRAYCHLCDEMLAAVNPVAVRYGWRVEVIDIDDPEHQALEALWGERVPVLFLGEPTAGNELCHYHLDAAKVSAAIGGAARSGR